MGKLRDELEKLRSKGQLKVNASREPAKTVQAASPRREPEVRRDQNWKAGVTPLKQAPAKQVAAREPAMKQQRPSPGPAPRNSVLRAPHVPPRPASATLSLPKSRTVAEPVRRPKPPVPSAQFGSFRPPALARDREFRMPDDWVTAGSELQPPGGGRGRALSVRIGIDFGTAYTKVAIRAADSVFFVTWDGLRTSDAPHFLPGELSRMSGGETWLGRAGDAEEIRSDLKLPFVARAARSPEQLAATIAYLAWVMRYSRAWLYRYQEALVRDRRLAWEINLGCPTNSWAAREIRSSYEEIGKRAWQLSQSNGVISWPDARAMLLSSDASYESIGLDGLKLMPEFIAQIAGYVKSPQARQGLHVLMDVGAGTVDIATFNFGPIRGTDENRYSIFASDVLPLGTHFLRQARVTGLGIEQLPWDDLQIVPDEVAVAENLRIEVARVRQIDDAFANCVTGALWKILNYTRERRYWKAPEWREGLPAFLSGGGSECVVYARSLERAFANEGVPLRRTAFPLLQEINGAQEGTFHRLSVAYGLTFDADSIGEILSPHEVEDAPRVDPTADTPKQSRRLDRDELYPK